MSRRPQRNRTAARPKRLPAKAAGRAYGQNIHHLGLHQSLENLGFSGLDSGTVARLEKKISPTVASVLAAGSLTPMTSHQQGNFDLGTRPRRGRDADADAFTFNGSHSKTALYGKHRQASATVPPPPPPSTRRERVASARTLATVVKSLDSHEKMDLLRHALQSAPSHDDAGRVEVADCREALGRVGVLLSKHDVSALTAAVGARDASGAVHTDVIVSRLAERADLASATHLENRVGSPARLNPRAASDRIVTRTLAASPTARPAGDTTVFINRRHLTTSGASAPELALMRSKRFEAQQPGEGVQGVKEAIFADTTSPFTAAPVDTKPAVDARRSALICNKLLDRLVDHVPDKAALRAFNASLTAADADRDGALSMPQFQRCLAETGMVVSMDDAMAIADAVGAGSSTSVWGTSHVSQSDIIRALHTKLQADREVRPPGVPASPVHSGLLDARGRPTQHRRPHPDGVTPAAAATLGRLDAAAATAADAEDTLRDVHGRRIQSRGSPTRNRSRDDGFVDAAGRPSGVAAPPSRGAGAAAPMNPTAIQLAWEASTSQATGSDAGDVGLSHAATAVRRRLRQALPTEPRAARAVLRHMLRRVDGDGDGSLSITELNRGLRSAIGAEVSTADVAAILHAVGTAPSAAASATGGSVRSTASSNGAAVFHADRGHLPIDAVADWLVVDSDQGGHGVPQYSSGAWEWLAHHGGHSRVHVEPTLGADGTTSQAMGAHATRRGDRDGAEWASVSASGGSTADGSTAGGGRRGVGRSRGASRSSATAGERARFETFRVAWESRHGRAAAKEMRMDAARKPPGPTWSSAAPLPFRVVKLSEPPPLPAASPS